MVRVLVVDDEPVIIDMLFEILTDEGYQVVTAGSGEAAVELLSRSLFDLVLLDIWMPGIDGLEVLERVQKEYPHVTVIIMSGHGSIETAVKAIKMGAYDYVEKPLSLEKVCLTISHALKEKRLEAENSGLRKRIESRYRIVGASPAVTELHRQIMAAAPTNGRVLISGENGTGKELVAVAIHNNSNRAKMDFVEVNCAAIPENLIESELLGHEKGAFTGAENSKIGKFEQAHGGTIFLDEIGDMSLATQAKVLRVLQEQRFCRVGGAKEISVDVRIIAASNKNLMDEIRSGNFREDLYYRLNVIPICVPPLRERKEDILMLADYFLESVCREERLKPKRFHPDTGGLLVSYSWPGNVRELKNIVERLAIMTFGSEITASDVKRFMYTGVEDAPAVSVFTGTKNTDPGLKDAKDLFEKEYIISSLVSNNWNISKTAAALKVERSHLHKKMKMLDISPE